MPAVAQRCAQQSLPRRKLSSVDTLSPTLLFTAEVLRPQTFKGAPVSTHVNAFRGYFWHGANGSRHSGQQNYDIALPWAMRDLRVTERDLVNKGALYESRNPAVIFLEFHHTTSETTEFRFGCHFDALALLERRELDLTAHNNNILSGNPAIRAAGVPKEYSVRVRLKAPVPALHDIGETTMQPEFPTTDSMVEESVVAAEWIANFLSGVLRIHTPFQNIRTFVRTPFVSPFFTTLPVMWRQPGTSFPVVVPLYLLLNALICNDYTQDEIIHDFPRLRGVKTPRLLRTVRDAIMGFTMCKTEGEYVADTLYGAAGDDQPFLSGMHNDRTFFARDDCEGRLQQGLLVKQAIESLAQLGAARIQDIVHQQQHPILRQLDTRLLAGVVGCAKAMAWLFDNGIMTLHMIVGEACFKSYPKDTALNTKTLAGHSFGALILNPLITPADAFPTGDADWELNQLEKGMHIIEATGWMDEYVDTRERIIANQYTRMFAVADLPEELHPNMRSCTTPEQCDNLYCFVYMIDEFLVFGLDEKTRRWMYGATPSHILHGRIHLLKPSQIMREAMDHRARPAQRIANPVVRQVVHELPARVWNKMMHALDKAHHACESIDTLCDDMVAYIHPPPDDESIMLSRLRAWHPLRTEHVPTEKRETLVAFSTPGEADGLPMPEGHYLESHPFMWSHMHLVKERDSVAV